MRSALYIGITILLFIQCEEVITFDKQVEKEEFIVIEGIITNEFKRHEIRITKPFNTLNEKAEGITGAVVVINDGEENIFLEEDPLSSGLYRSQPFTALFGKIYTLSVFYEGDEYYAQDLAAFGEPIKDLNLSEWTDSTYRFEYQESNSPSMMEVEIISDNQRLLGRFFTLNVIDVNRLFAPKKQDLIFPKGSMVVRRQYSLSEQHQEFLRSYLSEVDWRGGAFDIAPGNVITNFSGGAKGFFGVSMITTDTTIVN